MKLLREIERRGRPQGSTAIPEDVFETKYVEAYTKVMERSGDRPRQVDVANELGIDERTFRNYLKRIDLAWPPR